MSNLSGIQPLRVGDRVAKNGRQDGTGLGTVVRVERPRGAKRDTVTVQYDTGSIRVAAASLSVKI